MKERALRKLNGRVPDLAGADAYGNSVFVEINQASRTRSAVGLAALLAAAAPGWAQSILIDSFSANQATLTLTFPPAGTMAASSVVAGTGILGGERDIAVNLTSGVIAGNSMSTVVSSGFLSYSQDATISGNSVIQWDGPDGSSSLAPTGLGGVDLTANGLQDAFRIATVFDDLPIDVTIAVHTDGSNASTAVFTLPGLLFSGTDFVVPYSAFTPSAGGGADFSNVGAVTLRLGSTTTAPDVVLEAFQTAATLTVSMTDALQADPGMDGQASPGDTLRYTVVISNPDDAFNAAATAVVFTHPWVANTSLAVGSVSTTAGTVNTGNGPGDTAVQVSVGDIADNASVTITFDVVINSSLSPALTQISSQGSVSTSSLTAVLTDDPDTAAAAGDATLTPLVVPAPGACGTDADVATSTAPNADLCATGTAGAVTSTGGQWSWSCNGLSGSTNAACNAPYQTQTLTISANPLSIAIEGTSTATASSTSLLKPVLSENSAACALATRSDTAGGVQATVAGVAAGPCTVKANLGPSANGCISCFQAAAEKVVVITITKKPQAITVGPPPTVVVGGAGTVSATAPGGVVVFSSGMSQFCSVAGKTVTGLKAGTCNVVANQAGNDTFDAAPQVTQDIAIGKANQVITAFAANPAALTVGGSSVTLRATGGASGVAVTFSSTTPNICTVGGGNLVNPVAIGTCTVAANQLGNNNYNAAPEVTQNIPVMAATPTPTPEPTLMPTPSLPTATQSSGPVVDVTVDQGGSFIPFSSFGVRNPSDRAVTFDRIEVGVASDLEAFEMIDALAVYLDANGNREVDVGEERLSLSAGTEDGRITLSLDRPLTIRPGETIRLVTVLDLKEAVR